MYIPEQAKIGPYLYKVTYHDELWDDERNRLWGQVLYQEQEIKLLKGLSPDREGASFIHEVLHALAEMVGYQMPEQMHEALSVALYAFLKDNGYLGDAQRRGCGGDDRSDRFDEVTKR